MRNCKFITFLVAASISLNAFADKILAKEYYIPYGNQKIYLKEKKAAATKNGKVVVLVNPLSIPAVGAFDVPGYSLMDALAQRGYDVWGIDFIGEGKSSFPASMESLQPPTGVYPLTAKEAVKELHSGIAYISKTTGKKQVSLLGWSWGSVVSAMYSIQYPQQIDRLVLFGSMYSTPLAESVQPVFIKPYANSQNKFSESIPAYQNIPWQVVNTHWHMMINGNPTIVEESALAQVAKVYTTADPNPKAPNSLRRPMGPMRDLFWIWDAQPIYDISKLTTPTLVIYGDQDFFADPNLFSKLTKVKDKQEIVLKQATHWLIYEKTREQFVDGVVKFLNNE